MVYAIVLSWLGDSGSALVRSEVRHHIFFSASSGWRPCPLCCLAKLTVQRSKLLR
jgi:hypothetical protein